MYEVKELERKEREKLYKGIIQLGYSYEDAKDIFEKLEDECLIEITPPQMEEPLLQWTNVSMTHSGRYSGKTYKAGNVIFNIKESVMASAGLMTSLLASILTFSVSQPVLGILTIITAVLSAANFTKVTLDNNAALVLAVLWENKVQCMQTIEVNMGFELVNQRLIAANREKLSYSQYNDLLDDLKDIKSIEIRDGKIYLKEKIHISY